MTFSAMLHVGVYRRAVTPRCRLCGISTFVMHVQPARGWYMTAPTVCSTLNLRGPLEHEAYSPAR